MVDYTKELNAEQLDVVEHADGPCLVLAGAGSGKTRTITYRVIYLLEKGIDPSRILLLTFTNKAAREMMGRVSILVRSNVPILGGTFHHVALRVLKQYAPLIGYTPRFTILDSDDSLGLIKRCIKDEQIDTTTRRFPSPGVLQQIVSFTRNTQKTTAEIVDTRYPRFFPLLDSIDRVARRYAERKKEGNLMDFDDLLTNVLLLFSTHPRVREHLAEQFQYILVDEYQDTNAIQAAMVLAFGSHHRNMLVVGDDAQSIYSFRGADIANILDFEKLFPDAKIFRLETNYRSSPEIVQVANQVIRQNTHQYPKELRSVKDSHLRPQVVACSSALDEANFIAEKILELRDANVSLKKIAVLFRASFHSQAVEMELTKRDIPYEYRGGVRFFERSHIKDVLSFLRIIHNPKDAVAWNRVLALQIGIGPATANRIFEAVKEMEQLTDVAQIGNTSLISSKATIGWQSFVEILEALLRVPAEPAALIRAVLASSYAIYVEAEYTDAEDRMEDLKQLALFAERSESLDAFLADASLQEGYGVVRSGVISSDEEEQMVLSTIHQAKGLEWHSVFIVHLVSPGFPNDRALKEPGGLEEERRLLYVAVTRAEQQLFLTYPLMGGEGNYVYTPSPFLKEMDIRFVEELGARTEEGDTIFIEEEPLTKNNTSWRAKSFLSSIEDL